MAKTYDELAAALRSDMDPSVAAVERAARQHFRRAHLESFGMGEQIAKRRKELDWSQRRLAREADVPPADVSRIEHGKANPTLVTLAKLAGALDMDIRLVARP